MTSGLPDLAAIGRLLADRSRCTILAALAGGETRPATELARLAGISRSTASDHLRRLTDAGLIDLETRGRHRYFRLASPDVAELLESLAAVAPRRPIRSLRDSTSMRQLDFARRCYDHLAGRLGVALRDAMLRQGLLRETPRCPAELTLEGHHVLTELGADVAAPVNGRRPLVRDCLDWSVRRPHIGGRLGAAIYRTLLEQNGLQARSDSRAVVLGPSTSWLQHFGVALDELS